jgi:hypothetical protein
VGGYHEILGGLIFKCVIYLIRVEKEPLKNYDIDLKLMTFAVAYKEL